MSRHARANSSKQRRPGQVPIQVWVSEDCRDDFRRLAANEQRTMALQAKLYIVNAVNDARAKGELEDVAA